MPGFPRGPPLCSRGRHSCPDPFVSTFTDAQRTWDGGKESKIQATNRVIPSVPLLFQDSLWLACERNIPDAGKGRPPCGWHGRDQNWNKVGTLLGTYCEDAKRGQALPCVRKDACRRDSKQAGLHRMLTRSEDSSGDSRQEQCIHSQLWCLRCDIKIKVIFPCFMTHKFNPAKFHATFCGNQSLSPQESIFVKTDKPHEKNCRCNMFILHVSNVCRPF